MQVSQIAELDSHAVIGGAKAEAFGISEDAEFFTVLSDTLYRDKKRAVVREVICNAWDAHIMVGKTDLPIEITLTDDELIIKDFGPGIAPDRMRPIYCIYGKSTKLADGAQTGGFGLGSKAPFAYSDHFSVVSCHEGTRTVYAVSRGGRETAGKPDMRAMVQVPTTETGITVTIPIASVGDRQVFRNHICAVILQGGIKAKLNGELLVTYDYGPARKMGFALLTDGSFVLNEAPVYVLYGTVLYPVSTTDPVVNDAVSNLASMVSLSRAKFILIAPPHSIGVTPSRESLSYSEKTTETIIDLCKKARSYIKANVGAAAKRVVEARVQKLTPYNLWSSGEATKKATGSGLITNAQTLADYAVDAQFYGAVGNWKGKAMEVRAVARKFKDERRRLRRAAGEIRIGKNVDWHKSNWRQWTRLFVRLASKLDLLDTLLISGDGHMVNIEDYHPDYYMSDGLQPELIVGPNRRAIYNRVRELRNVRGNSGNIYAALLVRKPKDGQLDLIRKTAAGLKVELDELDFPKKARKKAASAKVFHSLANIKRTKPGKLTLTEEPSLEKAPLFIRCHGDITDLNVPTEIRGIREKLVERFGEIAIALNARQEAKLKAIGSVELIDHIIAEFKKLGDSREVQYAYLAQAEGFQINTHYWSSPAATASKLAKRSLILAKLLFPDPVRITGKAEEATRLAKLIEHGLDHASYSKNSTIRARFNEVRNEIVEKAKKTFGHLRVKSDDKSFDWLRPIRSIDEEKFTIEQLRLIILSMRSLEKRLAKSTTPETAHEDKDLKEAA